MNPAGATESARQFALGTVADVRIVGGPPMIRDEAGSRIRIDRASGGCGCSGPRYWAARHRAHRIVSDSEEPSTRQSSKDQPTATHESIENVQTEKDTDDQS